MSKRTKIILVIVVLVLLGVMIYFFMKKKSDDKEVTETSKSTSGLAGLDLGGIFGSILAAKKEAA